MNTRRVFISYRRHDALLWPVLIVNELRRRNADVSVFVDQQSNRLGRDYEERCLEHAARADVVLALVGGEWAAHRDTGQRRIDDPSDLLRRELLSAETGGALVIPVLLEGATWKELAPLPKQLAWIEMREAHFLSSTEPELGVGGLVKRLLAEEVVLEATLSAQAHTAEESPSLVMNNTINVNGPL